MNFLKSRTHVVSLDDYFAHRLLSHKINVIITFDDGYKSWVLYALPVLKELGLPATFFITSGLVGLTETREIEFMRQNLAMDPCNPRVPRGLTIEDIRCIVGQGFTIGGHTSSHCNLGTLYDIERLKREIGEDKLCLEGMTGKEVSYFAYPSGAYGNAKVDLTRLLKDAGYRGAVTTIPGFNNVDTNPFLLRRELTRASMSRIVFRARVLGNYDAVRSLKRRIHGIFLK